MTQAHNEALNAQLKQGGAGLPVPETVGEASLMLPGRDAPVKLRVLRGTAGADAVDVSTLYKKEHVLTYDPGFQSTAACESAVSYVDGEAGELTYRGYPIEYLAEHCDFLQTAQLLLKGSMPDDREAEEFRTLVKHHTMVHQQVSLLLPIYSVKDNGV